MNNESEKPSEVIATPIRVEAPEWGKKFPVEVAVGKTAVAGVSSQAGFQAVRFRVGGPSEQSNPMPAELSKLTPVEVDEDNPDFEHLDELNKEDK